MRLGRSPVSLPRQIGEALGSVAWRLVGLVPVIAHFVVPIVPDEDLPAELINTGFAFVVEQSRPEKLFQVLALNIRLVFDR